MECARYDIHQTVCENCIKAICLIHTLAILFYFSYFGYSENLLMSVVCWVSVTVDKAISCLI